MDNPFLAYHLVIAAVFGLCVGSFITLASWRMPRGEAIVLPRSRCPACRTPLRFFDLFPVVSWVLRGGTCHYCKTRIHWRYPVIELLTAMLFVSIFARYGLSMEGICFLLLGAALLLMTVIDFEHYIIPDSLQIFMFTIGVIYGFTTDRPIENLLTASITGLVVGLMLCYGFKWLRNKEGLGLGDVKFLGVAGIWLGDAQALVPFFVIAGGLGVVTALVWRALKQGAIFPFGPALGASLYACLLFPEIQDGYWQLQHYVWRPLYAMD